MEEKLRSRIELLRRRGNPGVAPLWAGKDSRGGDCADLFASEPPWLTIKRAEWDFEDGRFAEALSILSELPELQPGLTAMKNELSAEILEKIDAGGRAPEPLTALERWLENVRKWRALEGR